MGRAVDSRDEEGPERTCVVTRVKGAPERMIRFVLAPDGRVTPDIARRLPGRGVWVSPSAETLAKAVSAKAFSRAFKGKAEVSTDLVRDVDALLETDALQWLSIANKAGLVVAGFAKVQAAIGKGKLAALIHASDAGADGVEKLGGVARRAAGPDGAKVITIGIFNSGQLDLALGRPHVIHAALTSGSAAETLLSRCRRLALFRGLPWHDPVAETAILRDETPLSGAVSMEQTNGLGPGIANE
jgi:predicted RNA-binding protein YlxR (DUF448 family)